MKLKLLIILIFSLAIISCSKKESYSDSRSLSVPDELVGTWIWEYSSGGYAGVKFTPESTGDRRKIEFYADRNYKYYLNDILKSEADFRLVKDKSITGDSTLILISNSFFNRNSISFKNSAELVLFEECYDCFEHHYKKVE